MESGISSQAFMKQNSSCKNTQPPVFCWVLGTMKRANSFPTEKVIVDTARG